jgi:hypothetical protein
MKTPALALVVRELVRRRRSKRVRAVASRVAARPMASAVDATARTEALASALAECLFREIRGGGESSEVGK